MRSIAAALSASMTCAKSLTGPVSSGRSAAATVRLNPDTTDNTRHAIAGQRATTNTQRPTTNDPRPTTNDPRPTTNDQRLTTNDQRLTTNDQRLTTNDQRLTTNDQ